MKLRTIAIFMVVGVTLCQLYQSSNGAKIRTTSSLSNRRHMSHPYGSVMNPGRITPSEMRKVNSDKSNTNCAFCTIAGIQRTTTQKLTSRNGAPMSTDGVHFTGSGPLSNFKKVAQQSGFPNTKVSSNRDQAAVINRLNTVIRPGRSKTYGLGYPRSDGSGHFVALKAWRNPGQKSPLQTRVIDYQLPKQRRHSTVPDGTQYYLYDLGKKQRN